MENHHAINGKIHYKGPFSIAMLNYQRVYMIINDKDIRTIKDLWNGLCDLSARYTTSKPWNLEFDDGNSFGRQDAWIEEESTLQLAAGLLERWGPRSHILPLSLPEKMRKFRDRSNSWITHPNYWFSTNLRTFRVRLRSLWDHCEIMDSYLVGGLNPSEKYARQLGLLFPIYGKIIKVFQTTNQLPSGDLT